MLTTVCLIWPEKSVVSVEDEMANLGRWSTENKLVINLLKTNDMAFHSPNPRLVIPSPLPDDIERVNVFKLLGATHVLISGLVNIFKVLVTCNQRLYLICQLKK
jgi:hypothetical protein